jgi:hypothetical protein
MQKYNMAGEKKNGGGKLNADLYACLSVGGIIMMC